MAVALLSAALLSFEILLVRVFAIEHFHHFAYMAIGVAMLGFGASGTLVAGLGGGHRTTGFAERWWARSAALTGIALVAGPAAAHLIDLDVTRLAFEAGQWLRVTAIYGLLAIPFALGALAILSALAVEHARPGALYGASFAGAALGAAVALAALWVTTPSRALAVPAAVAALAAVPAARGPSRWAAVAIAGAALAWPPWRLAVSPYKGLPQVLAYPDARRVAERTGPVGWTVAVRAPAFRYAPGLSLSYRGPWPRQTALFVDGQLAGAAADWSAEPGARDLCDWLPSGLAYALGTPGHVLVAGAGDGMEVSCALAHGAGKVAAVELSPDLVRLVARFSEPSLAADERVRWVVGDARSFAARSAERFGLVTLGPGGAFGTTAAGVHALNEDFLHTVEAYALYLARLDSAGVLAITRWLTVPPRAGVRVILTAALALGGARPEARGRGLVVAHGWGTVTVLAKPAGFTLDDVAALRAWAAARGFDVDWYAGLSAPGAGMHALDEPVLFRAAAAGTAGADSARRFADAYAFDVHPATDARPYPHRFLRLASLGTLLTHARGEWLPFAEWGYLALLATLVQSAAVATILLFLPWAIRARRSRAGAGGATATVRDVLYFGAIGLGYLAAEIAAIQVLGLLLGHPIYGVMATLVLLLACSGAGSALSDRVSAAHGRRVAATVAVLLVAVAAVLLPLAHTLAEMPAAFRAAAAILQLAPLALLMGAPFPLGLRAVAGAGPGRVAWAWAANGFASVVAAPLAALIAVEFGSPALFLFAAGAYGVAAISLPK